MADYLIKGETLTAIADAIRDQGNIPYQCLTPTQMPAFIQNNLLSIGILERTITSISNTVVQQLGNYAFADCVDLDDIYLPEVSSVSKSAFYNCKPRKVTLGVPAINVEVDKLDDVSVMLNSNTNLEELYLPSCVSLYSSAVSGATNLRIADLPVVDVLTKSTFYKCTSLTQINFPNCGTTTTYGVGTQAFDGCTSLREVYLQQIKSMNGFAFRSCPIEIFYAPMLAGQHSSNPFTSVTTLKSVTTGHSTIPAWSAHWKNLEYYSNSVATNIASSAFYGCSLLNEYGFYAPNLSVATTQDTFRGTGFVEVTPDIFPVLSGTLGNYAFYTCPNLKSVHLSLITSTGNRTFGSCPNLEYVKLDNVTNMYTNASYPAFVNCTSLKEVHLPAYSGNIVANWLNGLTALEVVDIPYAQVIVTNAFKGCTSLSKVNFPFLSNVQGNAFSGCTELREVELGTENNAKITLTLSTNAFLNCTNLSKLTIYYDIMASLANASTIFNGTGITATTGSILVPAKLLSAYKSAVNWSNYKDRIYPLSPIFYIRGVSQTMTASSQTLAQWWATDNYKTVTGPSYTYSYYSVITSTRTIPVTSMVNGSIVTVYKTSVYKTLQATSRTSQPKFIKTSDPGWFTYDKIIKAGYINGVDGSTGTSMLTYTASISGLTSKDYITIGQNYLAV